MNPISFDPDRLWSRLLSQCHEGQTTGTSHASSWSSSSTSSSSEDFSDSPSHTFSDNSTVIVLAIVEKYNETSNNVDEDYSVGIAAKIQSFFSDDKSLSKPINILEGDYGNHESSSFDTQPLRGLKFISSDDLENETNSLVSADCTEHLSITTHIRKQKSVANKESIRRESILPLSQSPSHRSSDTQELKTCNQEGIPKEVQVNIKQRSALHLDRSSLKQDFVENHPERRNTYTIPTEIRLKNDQLSVIHLNHTQQKHITSKTSLIHLNDTPPHDVGKHRAQSRLNQYIDKHDLTRSNNDSISYELRSNVDHHSGIATNQTRSNCRNHNHISPKKGILKNYMHGSRHSSKSALSHSFDDYDRKSGNNENASKEVRFNHDHDNHHIKSKLSKVIVPREIEVQWKHFKP